MDTDIAQAALVRELRRVLPNLYNPGLVRRSELIGLLGLEQRRDAPSALQHLLAEAIEALEPRPDVPVGSSAWRVYQVLRARYVDQFCQDEVARDLFLSPRQLRRLEQQAVAVLADHLWVAYGLESQRATLENLWRASIAASEASSIEATTDEALTEAMPAEGASGDAPTASDDAASGDGKASVAAEPSGQAEELAWLERNVPSRPIDCHELIASVVNTARPLFDSLGVTLAVDAPVELPPLTVQPTAVRQALLHSLTLAARYAPGEQVALAVSLLSPQFSIAIRISVSAPPPGSSVGSLPTDEELEMVRKVLALSRGALQTAADGEQFIVTITLPTVEQLPVLVVDDNADTLRLVERLLVGSPYRCISAAHPREALALAEQVEPCAVLLDVMLPDMDGWELLGRLRAHPRTQHVPIIVCTILPQAQLALSLGASDFLSKPIRREVLLSTLDRLAPQAAPESA
jgi:CheY-like chemotaxis protein/signal transduction histidine kinase